MEKRFESLDIAKCIAIFAVIILHTIVYKPVVAATSLLMGATMLFFFLVTGYNYKAGRDVKTSIIKRAKRLLVPFVVYSVVINIICALIFIFADGMSIQQVIYNIKEFYTGTIGFSTTEAPANVLSCVMPYWFLIIMFLASAIFFPIADYALKSIKRISLISLVMLSITALSVEFNVNLPWHVEITPAFVAILLIGAYAGKNQILVKLQNIKGVKRAGIIILTIILTLILAITCGSTRLVSNNIWGNLGWISVFVSVLQAIIQFVMLVLISEIIAGTKNVKKPFIWIGENVMHFYILHGFFGFAIVKITGWPMLMFDREISTDPTKIIQSFMLMGCILVCVTVWILLEKSVKGKLFSRKIAGEK